ncbi:MAG: signal peptidase II [Lachnospiraceae bacterium]|nr:signal peptidase II [Lachnospiraceae bacterium]
MGLMMKKSTRCTVDLIIFAVLIFIDRITKRWAVLNLKDKEPVQIIRGILELHYLPNGNSGAAFGMLSGHRVLFLIIAAVVVGLIFYLVYNIPDDGKYRFIEILLIFIAAGGAGNMIDRFMQGYVVDFIYFSFINFPIFNVADMYVSICTVVLAISVLFATKEEDYTALETAFKAPIKKLFDKKKDQ